MYRPSHPNHTAFLGLNQAFVVLFLNRPAGGGVTLNPIDLEVSIFSCAATLRSTNGTCCTSHLPAVDALQGPAQAA